MLMMFDKGLKSRQFFKVYEKRLIKYGKKYNNLGIFCGVRYFLHCYLIWIYAIFFIYMSSDIANYADDITPYECFPY